MYYECCVCKTPRKDAILHRFPSCENRLNKWLKCLSRNDLKKLSPNELSNLFVCQKHFEKKFITSKTRLSGVAYPSLFSTDEIASGKPSQEYTKNVDLQTEHSYSRKRHFDHNYCRREPTNEITSPEPKPETSHYQPTTCSEISGVPLHHFPNPETNAEKFKAWILNIGGELMSLEHKIIYDNRRVCHMHFQDIHKYPRNRLSQLAIPVLHIPGTARLADSPVPTCSIADDDDSETTDVSSSNILSVVTDKVSTSTRSVPLPSETRILAKEPSQVAKSSNKPTPKKELRLRLLSDGLFDEPVYEVVSEDESDVAEESIEQDIDKCSSYPKPSEPSLKRILPGQDVKTAPKLIQHCKAYMPPRTKSITHNIDYTPSTNKDMPPNLNDIPPSITNMAPRDTRSEENVDNIATSEENSCQGREYWKCKLTNILHNTQFCGICLGIGGNMNGVYDDYEIFMDGKTHTDTLINIIDVVFKETENLPASLQICNSCTNKLIQTYMFIQNVKETSKMLNYHITDLYNKSCYIRNNMLKDGHGKVHNVVIFLENMNNTIATKEIVEEENQKHCLEKRKKIKCRKSNINLPSYNWKLHEATAKFKCRICLQSFKAHVDLISHYKMHFKLTCKICHRNIHDGGLLEHLKKHHKHSIHLCSTCNVAFYSSKALSAHEHDWHCEKGSKCLTCFKSLTESELELHQCMFSCTNCEAAPCVHHKYLMYYREQMLSRAVRAKCLHCQYVCTSKDALITHVNMQHLKYQPYSCDLCSEKFYLKSDVNSHDCKHVGKNLNGHFCKHCDMRFSVRRTCQQHQKGCARISRKFKCDYCPANFDTMEDQTRHRKLKHGKVTFSCTLCDRIFLNELKLKKHMLLDHRKQENKSKSTNCVLCQAKFVTEDALALHMRYHGSGTKYPCRTCNTQYDTLREYRSHSRKHHARLLAICEVCGKVTRRSLLKKHIVNTHKNVYKCQICGDCYLKKYLLKYHEIMHMEKVSCFKCNKMIKPARLSRHIRNHLIKEALDKR